MRTARVAIKGDPEPSGRIAAACAPRVRRWPRRIEPRRPAAASGDRRAAAPAGTRRSISSQQRFSETIAEHGPDSVAFYVSGQLLTEDYYVANKLMKGFIGSANIDTNSRLCMSSSVAGHRRAFGADTVPGTYEDLELADLVDPHRLQPCLVPSGHLPAASRAAKASTAWHEGRRHRSAPHDDGRHRRPASGDPPRQRCRAFRRPLRASRSQTVPSTRIMSPRIRTASPRRFCSRALLFPSTSYWNGPACRPMQLREFYRLFAATEKVVTCYSQGVNQSSSGTDKVNAILNCHLATGRIGRPGMGPFSLTGPAERHGRP